MHGFNTTYFDRLTQAVAAVEERTTAEIVVVVEPWSGNYRDVDFAVGAIAALTGLAVVLFNPFSQPEAAVLLDVLLFFAVGAWICSAVPALRRVFSRPRRRDAQVQAAAGAAFFQEDVWTTRARTGLLIYVSLLERQVLVLPDRGITPAVNTPAWNTAVKGLKEIFENPEPAAALLHSLGELGIALSTALPPGADNPDELPNRPRGKTGAQV